MPKLPPSKVAALLGISDKSVVRAINKGDLRDYQQRDPDAPLPKRGPRFILVDLEEAHRYFREKGLLGRVPATPETEIVSKIMEEMGEVKQELALISELMRGASALETTRSSYPYVRTRRDSLRQLSSPTRLATPDRGTTVAQLEPPADGTTPPSEPTAAEDGAPDYGAGRYSRSAPSSPLIAFEADKTSRPHNYRGPRTVPLRSDLVYLTSENELPPGSIKPKRFAALHNVASTTLISQVQERRVSSHAIQTHARDQRLDRWLTPDDQQSVLNHWNVVGTRYRPCPDCPHLVSNHQAED